MSGTTTAMNCNDYREALLAEPGFEDETGHVDSCTECQTLRTELLALDDRIARALDVSVPELVMPELPEIDQAKVTDISTRRRPAPVWYAMAASLVLAVLVGIQVVSVRDPGTLAEQVLAHVDHDSSALEPSTTPVSDRKISRVVPENLATMRHEAGLITYAESCSINGRPVPHLVIQGERGPITILLMPEEPVAEATALEGDNIRGIILPVGNGSIAIIGDREEELEDVTESVLDSVTWST